MKRNELPCVAIRAVEEAPLISSEEMSTPGDAVRIVCRFLEEMDREYFCIVNLQSDTRPICMNVVSIGTLSCSVVHPREVFKSAILANAASIILIHNHPSGRLSPSNEDLEITKRLQQAGTIIGIQVVDHVIAGHSGDYFSFREHGILQENEESLGTAAEYQYHSI